MRRVFPQKTAFSDQKAIVFAFFENGGASGGGRFLGGAVFYEFHTDHEAPPTDLADEIVFYYQIF